MSGEAPPCLLSVHDVMPETFSRVEHILQRLAARGQTPVTLLVVPGKEWTAGQLDQLHLWVAQGHRLAAHGWSHQISHLGGLFHWLHARLISRDVAEHLSLDSAGIAALMKRSRAWFVENDFPAPTLYVPPAWALGFLHKDDRRTLPFTMIEVLRGLRLPSTGELIRLPLVGFEADTAFRRAFVSWWNRTQVRQARRSGRPLRFSIHPDDFSLRLRDALNALLALDWKFCSYDDPAVFARPAAAPTD